MNRILYSLFAAIISVSSLFAFWAVRPYSIIDNVGQMEVSTPVVPVGGQVTYHFKGCTYFTGPYSVRLMLDVDGNTIDLFNTIHITQNEPRCFDMNQDFKLPDWVQPGVYRLGIELTVPVNPLRNEVVYLVTDKFRVE